MMKPNFLDEPAPANYVTGLRCGATGFTTGSDIGPTHEDNDDDEDDRFQHPENEVGLFARGAYDEAEDKADSIYQSVDEKMEKRQKSGRGAREKVEREEYERKNPKIQHQFASLKRGLETLTDDDFANFPDVGDLIGRNRRRARQAMRQKFYPTLDSALVNDSDSQFQTSVQDEGTTTISANTADEIMTNYGEIRKEKTKDEGTTTISANTADGIMTNFGEIRKEKTKVLTASLDRSEVPHLTHPEDHTNCTAGRRYRYHKTNPKHGPGGIAAALLEAVAGKMVQPRSLIAQEAMRLNEPANAKIKVADSVSHNPKSVNLWVEGMELEKELKALDIIPHSVVLWKEAIKLKDDPADAKTLVARAVQLALLNKARKAIPTIRLQGQQGNTNKVNVMKRRVQIKEAEKCKEEGAVETCQAIIRETPRWQLEDLDRKKIWIEDAEASISKVKYETARAICAFTLRVFWVKKSIWHAAADFVKNHGRKEPRWNVREKGPNNEDMWLAAVKLEAENTQHATAREPLATARREDGTHRAWVKSVAFERQQENTNTVLYLVNHRLQLCPKAERFWMMKGPTPPAQEAYNTGTKACPTSVTLWLLLPLLEENPGILVRDRLASVRVERRAKNTSQEKTFKRTHYCPCLVEAIGKVGNNPILYITVAQNLWVERKLPKAINLFEKAILVDPDYGDTWAWNWRIRSVYRTEVMRGDVLNKLGVTEPGHGEVWQNRNK
ncbi:hypothetical protein L873DRAFT_1838664 [Choiromyces venosus 120613-1]|uniref:PRP1 splicing factor N-terminal domain-containing protein n=1 Tax=Choiromyces venosus 120613-1 TaxID=1336337 RepID=A0A3N4J2Y8_9PEZI|nr:hypothetical protein L873DRAFT_1838664 [Choiromyces venosus 120613-1]